MKPKINKPVIIAFLICASALQRCATVETQQQEVKRNAIIKPFENLAVNETVHYINTSSENTVNIGNGTKLRIPANAFVDKNNKPVTGHVCLKYKEMHNPADIIISGIPMSYDSAGQKFNFESAGMFEISGFSQEGVPIYIADGKSIQVEMASFIAGNDYQFYKLDESSGDWQYEGRAQAGENANKIQKLEELSKPLEKPGAPRKCLDTDFILDFNLNYSKFPELKEFISLMWTCSEPQKCTDNGWISNEKWTDIRLLPYKPELFQYELTLSNARKEFKTVIEPVFSENDYEEAVRNFNEQMECYNKKIKEREAEYERAAKEADLIRTFNINGFGIYNWDKISCFSNALFCSADFKFDKNIDTDLNKITIFHITGNGNTVIKYSESEWKLFRFIPTDKNRIVAVLPDNKIAVFSGNDFEKINVEQIRAMKQPSYTFQLKTISQSINSSHDLFSIISSI
ncbi:MAG: hypothetical protein HY738_20455 [Bacteroidia bacterium]|nr:hypothetical protein [Bacteroidia bacterium]